MKTFHLSQTITGLFLLTMCYLVQAKLECAVDERLNIALNTYSVEWPSVILLETENVTDENQCYEACCDFIEKGEHCNAASFIKEGSTYICINARCTPFSSCEFIEYPFGLAAKVAVFNATVNFDESENSQETGNNTGSTDTSSDETATDETIEEEVEELFETQSKNDSWNIIYDEYDYSTSTLGYYEDNNSAGEGEGNTIENQQGTSEKTGGDESTIGGNEESTAHGGDTESTSVDDKDEDVIEEVGPVKPHLTHGNSGIYGPKEVTDFDYSSTPLIVIGVVVTVLFLLLLLVFVGRKILHDDRLKYRPLRDSFPAANAYHDLEIRE